MNGRNSEIVSLLSGNSAMEMGAIPRGRMRPCSTHGGDRHGCWGIAASPSAGPGDGPLTILILRRERRGAAGRDVRGPASPWLRCVDPLPLRGIRRRLLALHLAAELLDDLVQLGI